MQRVGIFALSLAGALTLQGCIFLPADDGNGDDPFFFEVDNADQNGAFVGTDYQPAESPLPSTSHQDSVDVADSTRWFFPVIRVY